jgi:hypothetical protein
MNIDEVINIFLFIGIIYYFFQLVIEYGLYKRKNIVLQTILKEHDNSKEEIKGLLNQELMFKKQLKKNSVIFISLYSILNTAFFYFKFSGKELFLVLTAIVLIQVIIKKDFINKNIERIEEYL